MSALRIKTGEVRVIDAMVCSVETNGDVAHGRYDDRRDRDKEQSHREEQRREAVAVDSHGSRNVSSVGDRGTNSGTKGGPAAPVADVKPSQNARVNLDPDWDEREEGEEVLEDG